MEFLVKNQFQSLIILVAFTFSLIPRNLRAENSLSSEIESDEKYQAANKEFEIILQAAVDVGEKECKSDAPKGELARSAWLWFSKGKILSDAEKLRFKVYQSEIERIKKRMQAILDSKDKSTMQSDGILLQAELLTTEMFFIWGNTGRLESRVGFLTEIKNAPAAANYENKLWLDSYNSDLVQGLNQALGIAKNACDQKEDKKVKGCDDAQAQIQNIQEMILTYKEKYQQKNQPSQKIHDELVKEEEKITNAIKGMVEGNQEYDWKTPATKGLEKTVEVRKKVNVFCPDSRESKSQNKAVKLAEIFEDKDKSNDEKLAAMKKIDESLANSLIGGGLSISDLKKIPTEWNRQNNQIALGANREPLVSEVVKKIEELIALDRQKYELIKDKRNKIYKLIMAMGDMTKSKLDVNAECGANPSPGMTICPSTNYNPLCDINSTEYFNRSSYNSCRLRVEQQNDALSQLAKASDDIKNNPNVIGVEPYYLGTVGPIWRAIIKKPDGSISYENIIKNASQYGADYSGATFGGVQNDPKNNKPNNNNPSSTTSGGGGGTSGGGSSNNKPDDKNDPCKVIGNAVPALNEKDLAKSKETYLNQLKNTASSNTITPTVFCGAQPFKYEKQPNGSIKECKSNDAAVSTNTRLEYEGCQKAVGEYNQMVKSGKIILKTEDQKTYDKFINTLVTKKDKTPVKVSSVCGENPCKITAPSEDASCTVAPEDQNKFKEFNICLSAVNDYNEKLNVEINLSGYIKTHPDYVDVIKHPDTGVWVAKMIKKSTGKVYYLPLNYTEGN